MNESKKILERIKSIEERLDRIESTLGISEPLIREELKEIAEEVVDSIESENTTHESGGFTYSDVDAATVQIDYYSWDGRPSVFIPSQIDGKTVVGIGDEAFIRLDIKQVVFPSTLKYIGDRAFYECKKIEALDFPKGLKHIGEEAFSRCYQLKKVVFPLEMESMGPHCFSCSDKLSVIKLPVIKEIPASCFLACCSRKVTIPEGVEKIGDSAFSFCELGTVELPKSLRELGFDVFTRQYSFNKINLVVPSKKTEISHLKYDQNMTVFCLPGSKAEKVARQAGGTVECRPLEYL